MVSTVAKRLLTARCLNLHQYFSKRMHPGPWQSDSLRKPEAVNSGTMATTMDAVVIRIGRRRIAAARSIAARLARYHTVVRVDRRGSGRSVVEGPAEPIDVAVHVVHPVEDGVAI